MNIEPFRRNIASTTKSRRNRSDPSWLFLLTASCATISASSSSLPVSSMPKSILKRPFCTDSVANFIRQRCGSNIDSDGIAVWAYDGYLTDPMTGKVVAEVEGLELVKSLPMITHSLDKSAQSILGDLSVRDLLFPNHGNHDSSSNNWDSATTILSRRLFCYRQHSSGKDNGKLLTSLRLRPDGPLRPLSSAESVAVYDSAITYISRNQGREMVVFSERGGGIHDGGFGEPGDAAKSYYVMGSAQSNLLENHQLRSGFDFAIHARKGTFAESKPSLPPMKLSSEKGEVISPRRSRLIHFGRSGESDSGRKYDNVRETYNYSFDNPVQVEDRNHAGAIDHSKYNLNWVQNRLKTKNKAVHAALIDSSQEPLPQCTVRYTRYGEAPPWYAPGRMCTLELMGKRVALPQSMPLVVRTNKGSQISSDALSPYLPPLALWAARKCKPSFLSGWPEEHSCNRAVSVFCTEGQRSVTYDALDDQHSHMQTRAYDIFTRLQCAAERLKKSLLYDVDQ